MSQTLKKVGPYRLIEKIGKGATSEVFLGRKDGVADKYAVKMIRLKGLNQEQKQAITKEVTIIKSIQHRNIVHLYDTFQTVSNYYLVFELCEQGDLQKYLMEYHGLRVPEETAQRIIYCIADAVGLIHSKGIAHRDIKLANILLKNDFQIKLADFGFAKVFHENVLMETYCGTPITMAPEILLSLPYDKKCDVWSLGIILFQLVYGRLPFSISQGLPKFMEYVTEKPLEIPSQPEMPTDFKILLHNSLQKKAANRYSIKQFLENPWVQQGGNLETEGKSKKGLSVDEFLRGISSQYRRGSKMENISKTQSTQVQLIVAQRVNKTLTHELDKLLKRHVKLRESLKQRLENEVELMNLLLYLDQKFLQYLRQAPIKVGKQNSQITIKSIELDTIEFPKPLSLHKPQSQSTGKILLQYLKKKSNQTQQLEQKIKQYEIVIDILEMTQRFDIRVVIMFANHLYEDIEVGNVINNIKSKRINEEVSQAIEFTKGNFITIAMQCYDKNQKMKETRDTLKKNCAKRISEIQRQINGF